MPSLVGRPARDTAWTRLFARYDLSVSMVAKRIGVNEDTLRNHVTREQNILTPEIRARLERLFGERAIEEIAGPRKPPVERPRSNKGILEAGIDPGVIDC